MLKMYVRMMTLLRSRKGQGMVEYGLIIGLVAVLLIGALVAMRQQLGSVFSNITGQLSSTPTP